MFLSTVLGDFQCSKNIIVYMLESTLNILVPMELERRNQSFSDKFLKFMVFVMKRNQKNKIPILDVNNKDKPVAVELNWEIEIIAVIKRPITRGSFGSTS